MNSIAGACVDAIGPSANGEGAKVLILVTGTSKSIKVRFRGAARESIKKIQEEKVSLPGVEGRLAPHLSITIVSLVRQLNGLVNSLARTGVETYTQARSAWEAVKKAREETKEEEADARRRLETSKPMSYEDPSPMFDSPGLAASRVRMVESHNRTIELSARLVARWDGLREAQKNAGATLRTAHPQVTALRQTASRLEIDGETVLALLKEGDINKGHVMIVKMTELQEALKGVADSGRGLAKSYAGVVEILAGTSDLADTLPDHVKRFGEALGDVLEAIESLRQNTEKLAELADREQASEAKKVYVQGDYAESKVEIRDSVVNRSAISGRGPQGRVEARGSSCHSCGLATQPSWKLCPHCGAKL